MMRFCPFCSAENADDASACQRCARGLPALPQRRAAVSIGSQPTAVGPGGMARRPGRPTPALPITAPFDERPDSEPLLPLPEPTLAPPPTRLNSSSITGLAAAPMAVIDPLPEPPDGGLFAASRYTIAFARALWQRRIAIRNLNEQIRTDTTGLDGLLGALGRTVRQLGLNNRALAPENLAIDEAEKRRDQASVDSDELARRLEEENQRHAEQSGTREGVLRETDAALDRAEKELEIIEAQRRALRDKRKTVERQQRGYLKGAEDREADAARSQMGDQRMQLRKAAEDLRRDAAALDPERQDIERRLAALDKPVSQASAKVEALRGEQDSMKRALNDLREGHRHRLSELEAEQGKKGRDATTADAEIARRMVTLGTLSNLNRVERPEFDEIYARIDQLRTAIGGSTQEIDRLTAERESYDRGALVRGGVVLTLGLVALITGVALLLALL